MTQMAEGAAASPLEELYATTFHQLRAPVSSINGYASLLLTGELGGLRPRQREPLERIQEICRSLTGTIGNLLTLAKSDVRQTGCPKSFVNVSEVAREVGRSLQGEIRRKKLRFIQRFPAKPVLLWSAPGDLTQIFLNLLSNASKFTPPKGAVWVKVALREEQVFIEVSDTGAGISPEDLPKIFEEFYHVDHPETGAGSGSGLGLTIVNRVVTAYGGEIKVNSRVGRGTSFHVFLPVRPEEEVLQEFLEETWVRARKEGQYVGLILLQACPASTAAGERAAQKVLAALERAVRDCVRREDRVFHLPSRQLLAVLVRVSREGFGVLTQRLERAVRPAASAAAPRARQPDLWKWVTVLVPRRGSPARFLDLTRRRLSQACKAPLKAQEG